MGEKTVNSLKEFVGVLEMIDPNQEVFFRGESNYFKFRTPSIYRQYQGEVATRSHEYCERLFAESSEVDFNSLRPFERLTEVQHFGGLTRFIDITSNALVALFFATDNDDNDGYVYIYKSSETKVDVGDTAYLKAAVNFIDSGVVRDFLSKNDDRSFEDLTAAIREFDPQGNRIFERKNEVYETLSQAQIVIATKSNPRIIRQQGAFILPAYEVGADYETQTEFIGESIANLGLKDSDGTGVLVIHVPKEKKAGIRRTLSNVGVNIGAIYPDIEHQSQVVASYLGEMRVNAEVQREPVEEKKQVHEVPKASQTMGEQRFNVVENESDVVETLIESLRKSPNFNTTHAVIRRLDAVVDVLSDTQMHSILEALRMNDQVSWILSNEDVALFYEKIMNRFKKAANLEKFENLEPLWSRIEEAVQRLSDLED